ncbi:MAG: pyrimidine/purine nucleoside phosphorylase [Spirochaetales bacterium]|nr:pyrimidine/purine nucleoside phosphorylase [Spirochaetales bacterium]
MKHNSYFDGKVQSLSLSSEGKDATIGVISPGTYRFSTSTKEKMNIISGSLTAKVPGQETKTYTGGTFFIAAAGVEFEVSAEADCAYLCIYG